MLRRLFRPAVILFGVCGVVALGVGFSYGVSNDVGPAVQARDTVIHVWQDIVLPRVPIALFYVAVGFGLILLFSAFVAYVLPSRRHRKNSPVPKDGGPKEV